MNGLVQVIKFRHAQSLQHIPPSAILLQQVCLQRNGVITYSVQELTNGTMRYEMLHDWNQHHSHVTMVDCGGGVGKRKWIRSNKIGNGNCPFLLIHVSLSMPR